MPTNRVWAQKTPLQELWTDPVPEPKVKTAEGMFSFFGFANKLCGDVPALIVIEKVVINSSRGKTPKRAQFAD